MTDTTNNTTRLVLGDDSVICRDCYEPDALELNPDRRDRSAAVLDLRRKRQPGRSAPAGTAAVTTRPPPRGPRSAVSPANPTRQERDDDHDRVSWPPQRRALLERLDVVDVGSPATARRAPRRPASAAPPMIAPCGCVGVGDPPRRQGEATDTRRPRCRPGHQHPPPAATSSDCSQSSIRVLAPMFGCSSAPRK